MSEGLVQRSDLLGLEGMTHLYTAAESPMPGAAGVEPFLETLAGVLRDG